MAQMPPQQQIFLNQSVQGCWIPSVSVSGPGCTRTYGIISSQSLLSEELHTHCTPKNSAWWKDGHNIVDPAAHIFLRVDAEAFQAGPIPSGSCAHIVRPPRKSGVECMLMYSRAYAHPHTLNSHTTHTYTHRPSWALSGVVLIISIGLALLVMGETAFNGT
eukprot:scaffold316218_cov22-Tisochrysis_lutea.AAC.1